MRLLVTVGVAAVAEAVLAAVIVVAEAVAVDAAVAVAVVTVAAIAVVTVAIEASRWSQLIQRMKVADNSAAFFVLR